jgi:5-methylcytosine-specific restriction endonuclease McrA
MNDPFADVGDNDFIAREKFKARELRQSQWWKRKCSKGQCSYCDQKVSPKKLTMDHIVPISLGGRTTRNNVTPACKECNTKKKTLLPFEWQKYVNKRLQDNT